MNNSVEYKIIVSATGENIVQQLNSNIQQASKSTNTFIGMLDKVGEHSFHLNQLRQSFQALSNDVKGMVQPGMDFETSMANVQAIGGATGEGLRQIGLNARKLAVDFGISAAGSADAFKYYLSQLGPDIAKSPEALRIMGKNAAILSKQMGGDIASAAQVLTTAMNSYAIDMSNPIKATAEMTKQMNMMSASAKAGASELPELKETLAALGPEAKNSGLSFADTLASTQVLKTTASKTGSEAGTVLRNILIQMNKGRFLPRDTRVEMQAAGVDVFKLGDSSVPFVERLRELKKIQNDKALLGKFAENYNLSSAQGLLESIDSKDTTRSFDIQKQAAQQGAGDDASKQAGVLMNTTPERLKRLKSGFEDFGISMQQAFAPITPFVSGITTSLGALGDFGMGIGGLTALANTGFAQAIRKMTISTFGLAVNFMKSGVAAVWSATVGLAAYVGNALTATAAQWGLNIAMDANPIGAIVLGFLAIGAAVGAVIHWWDTIKQYIVGFAKFMIKLSPFYWLYELIGSVFPEFKKWVTDVFEGIIKFFTQIKDAAKDTFNGIKSWFGFGNDSNAALSVEHTVQYGNNPNDDVLGNDTATPEELKRRKLREKRNKDGSYNVLGGEKFGGSGRSPISDSLGSVTAGGSGGGNGVRNINTRIGNLVGTINIHAANVKDGAASMKEHLVKALVDAVRDGEVSLATS